MASNFYIKLYFTKEDETQPEIRRININFSPENDVYNELLNKISPYVLKNDGIDFSLQYIDEDNERITFSSNEELRSAMALYKNTNTLKIYVTFIKQKPQQKPEIIQDNKIIGETHVGIECNGCKGPVIGFRYKCFVCTDYDLCEKCASAGIHTEHNMIRITKPENFPSHWFQHPHFPPPPPPHSHHLSAFMPQFLEHVQTQIPKWVPNQGNTHHSLSHIQRHLEALKKNSPAGSEVSKEYLESVGKNLKETLSPYGIDCDYFVEEAKPVENQTNAVQTDLLDQENVTNNSVAQQEQQVIMKNDENESVSFVDTAPSDDINTTNVVHEVQTPTLMTLSQIQNPPRIRGPIEIAVDDCVQRLIGMGFCDNATLRELIASKKGDINLVLDAINTN